MTKKELAKKIADDLGIPQLTANAAVEKTFDGIIDTLLDEGRVEFRNFGVFEVRKRKARAGRNPKTGEQVDVPARCVVSFKPGKEMEEKVGQLEEVPGKVFSS